MAVTQAPFETFTEYNDRVGTGEPYNEDFLSRCRDKAKEYDREDVFLRGSLLRDLQKSIPIHYRSRVFDGISFNFAS